MPLELHGNGGEAGLLLLGVQGPSMAPVSLLSHWETEPPTPHNRVCWDGEASIPCCGRRAAWV